LSAKLTPEDIAAAGRMHAAGRSIRSLASDFGVNESTLRRALRSQAVPPPGTQGAPEVPVIHRHYEHLEKALIYPLGDFHIGSPQHAREKLDRWLDYILETPHATLLGTGDILNAAILGSKSDSYAEVLTPQEAIFQAADRMRPVADAGRIDLLMGGNHEARIQRATGIDPVAFIARELRVPHVEGAVVLVYHVGDQEYSVFLRHGTGNSPASTNAVTKTGLVFMADVAVTGHTHRQQVVLEDSFVLSEDGSHLERRPRRYVTAGSFVGYERYAAERGYSPAHLGAPRIFLDGSRRDVHVSI